MRKVKARLKEGKLANAYSQTAFYKALGVKVVSDKPSDLSPIDEMLWSSWASGDGIASVPETPRGVTPGDFLQLQIKECTLRLRAMNVEVEHDIKFDPEHYRYRSGDGIRVAQFEAKGETPGERLMHFDLGGHLVGQSTDDFCATLAAGDPTGLMLLEPAGALNLITKWLDRVRRIRGHSLEGMPTMHVECAGAEYSPDGNGKFNDVPRWDFYAPMRGSRKGLLFLNWNWSRRARPAQGVAIAAAVRNNI